MDEMKRLVDRYPYVIEELEAPAKLKGGSDEPRRT